MSTDRTKATSAVLHQMTGIPAPDAPIVKGGRILEHPEAVPEGIPTKDWSPEKLGEFAATKVKSKTEAAWFIGRACRARKEQGAGFSEWRKKYLPLMSERTLQRYQAIAVYDLEVIEGKSQGEVYELLYGRPEPVKRGPAQPTDEVLADPVPAAIAVIHDLLMTPGNGDKIAQHKDELKALARTIFEVL